MVRDGYFYALGCLAAAVVVGWVAWPLAFIPVLLGIFCLWFFRDPERMIPVGPGAIVSCADGKVTDVSTIQLNGQSRTRISIFLNVFNVHVNRSPIGGVITDFAYKHGQYRNAMGPDSAELNEQSICTVIGDNGEVVVFKQIAGLIARRIVFNYKVGDRVARGQRVGMIKFGSRCDVLFSAEAQVSVKIGDHVKGGSSVLAVLPVAGGSVPAPHATTPERY
ncbi:MAG: phosphatidylserine decarboxylase [Terriglobia bacterium]|jgi:phosphatidylserine decarboxylase|nr:phosphatidylserine decarboxylase [Terriglobia bacterium]